MMWRCDLYLTDLTTSTKPPKCVMFAYKPRTSKSLFELKSKALLSHSNSFTLTPVVRSLYRLRQVIYPTFSWSMTTHDGRRFTYTLTRRRRPALQRINTMKLRSTQGATVSNVLHAIMAVEIMTISSSQGYWQHVAQHLSSVLHPPIITMELRRESFAQSQKGQDQ